MWISPVKLDLVELVPLDKVVEKSWSGSEVGIYLFT
jgi:hypothetical protein